MGQKKYHALVWLVSALALTGCANRQWNMPVAASPIADPYTFANRLPKSNARDIFVVLAFSGGGMRSAAFSYGILEALRDTEIPIRGQTRRLLDEVDVISSVSGGSFTAAYYGLFGQQIFTDYAEKVLYQDIQGELTGLLLNPVNLFRIMASDYNRGDLAGRWLNKNLFQNKTFADMSLGELPYVIINATDLNTSTTFSFLQQQFDFLCSDINHYPIAYAVQASSAVPVISAPVSLKNFDTGCQEREADWISEAIQGRDISSRNYLTARGVRQYLEPATLPVIRLVDGGVTDNLGVRGSIMNPVAHYGDVAAMSGAFTLEDLAKVRDVLVIVANTQVYAPYDWSKDGDDPGLVSTIAASFDAALNILNTATVTLAEESFQNWAAQVNEDRIFEDKVNIHFVTLTFDRIADDDEREFFNTIPTTLTLSEETVDRIRNAARHLLANSIEFNDFVTAIKDE